MKTPLVNKTERLKLRNVETISMTVSGKPQQITQKISTSYTMERTYRPKSLVYGTQSNWSLETNNKLKKKKKRRPNQNKKLYDQEYKKKPQKNKTVLP